MSESTRRQFNAGLIVTGMGSLSVNCGATVTKPLPVLNRGDFEPAYVRLVESGELERRVRGQDSQSQEYRHEIREALSGECVAGKPLVDEDVMGHLMGGSCHHSWGII